eukprot:gene6211-11619_t
MVYRKKMVFMIDVNPLTSQNASFCFEDTVRLIRFSIVRILTYFGGRHRSAGGKSDTSPLWGFKFYKSSGGQLEYGNHHFYDLKLKDFENFEEELELKLAKAKEDFSLKSRSQGFVADQLSCALAEVVTGFQWERPDFFSPVKANRKTGIEKQNNTQNRNDASNFVFLFTPCPCCCGDVSYFSNGKPSNPSDLKAALMKDEVYKKMTLENKIVFHWVDLGSAWSAKMSDDFHGVLSTMMTWFSGSLIPIENISYWWVQGATTKAQKTCQPDSFSGKSASSTHQYLPVILRNVLLQKKGFNASNDVESVAIQRTPTKQSELQDCAEVQDTVTMNLNGTMVAEMEGVFKSSAILMFLQNSQESYYCTFDYSQGQDGNKRVLTAAFISLLRILKTKHLILIIKMNHPENGRKVSACLQSWTASSGVLTILSSPIGIECRRKHGAEDFAKQQQALVEGLIKSIHSKLANRRSMDSAEVVSSDQEILSALTERTALPTSSSFMQAFNHWFFDLPSHSLPSKLHQNIERIQNVEPEKVLKADQVSTGLFKKLKECYKSQRCAGKKEREISLSKESNSAVTKLKSRTFSRSEHMLAKSKANTMKKKSEEEIKKRERVSSNQETEGGGKRGLEGENEAEEDPLKDIDLIPNDLSTMDIDSISGYIKDQIAEVLVKDLSACESIVRKLSRAAFLFLNKHNESKEATERISPDHFLENVFNNLEDVDDNKHVKVARHITRVLMELEMAVLKKVTRADESSGPSDTQVDQSSKETLEGAGVESPGKTRKKSDCGQGTGDYASADDTSDDEDVETICPVAERVIGQLRPLIFLENTGFLAKYLNSKILPRFKTKIPNILHEIYEGLGHQTPLEILTPSKQIADADDSFDIAEDDPASLSTTDYGSNQPSNQSGTTFRRFLSINDSMATKRQIMVPAKRSNKNGTKRAKKGYQDNPPKPSKEGWCRNLFDTGTNNEETTSSVSGCRKRKLQRRYTEIAPSVKDTPAVKQRRHFFWKKQHKQRRKTDCITNVTVIEESPLKECNIEESPVKSASSATRFFSRSQSFSCKTSPRRFYASKRYHPELSSLQNSSFHYKFGRSISCLTDERKLARSESDLEDNRKEEVEQFSVYKWDKCQPLNIAETPEKPAYVSPVFDEDSRETKFGTRNQQATLRMRSLSMDASPLPAMTLTPKKLSSDSVLIAEKSTDRGHENYRPKRVLDLLEIASATESFGFDSRLSTKPLMYSEDSMDWVAMLENDRESNEPNDVSGESPLPVIDSVPSLRESECGSVKGNSPNIFTPIREGKQPFSSPFLSASSLETLETAPIISPRLRGSKLNKEISCRKRIKIPIED